mgnify:CR=1 FL=1
MPCVTHMTIPNFQSSAVPHRAQVQPAGSSLPSSALDSEFSEVFQSILQTNRGREEPAPTKAAAVADSSAAQEGSAGNELPPGNSSAGGSIPQKSDSYVEGQLEDFAVGLGIDRRLARIILTSTNSQGESDVGAVDATVLDAGPQGSTEKVAAAIPGLGSKEKAKGRSPLADESLLGLASLGEFWSQFNPAGTVAGSSHGAASQAIGSGVVEGGRAVYTDQVISSGADDLANGADFGTALENSPNHFEPKKYELQGVAARETSPGGLLYFDGQPLVTAITLHVCAWRRAASTGPIRTT